MNVTLPNGTVIQGIPEGTTKEQVMQKAIAAGLAKQEDFQPAQSAQQPTSFADDALQGVAEAGRSIAQAGVNVANIIPEVGDAVQSAATWAAGKLGIGDSTYTPAMRFSLPESLQPQTQAGQIASEAIPFLVNPASRLAPAAEGLAAKATDLITRSAAESAVGTLAANSNADNPKNLASDLAENAALGGVTRGLTNAVGAGYRALRGTMTPEAAAATQFADNAGAPLLTSDVAKPGTFAGRSAQALAEKIPVTGTGAVRRSQQEARSQLVQDYANTFAAPAPEEIVQSLRRQTSKVKQAAGQRLSQVNAAMQSVGAIQPTNALTTIDGEIAKLSKLGQVADTQTINKLQAYRDELASGADFEQLRNLRTQFRLDVKGDRNEWPNQSQASVNRVYSALTGDIDDAVKSNLGGEAANKYRQANAAYASEAQLINNTRLKNVLQKGDLTPEVANNLLFSSKPSEVRQLYSSLDQRGRNSARAAVIGKAYEKSGGSPDKFLNEINRLSSQTGILFKGQDRQYLKGLTNYLDQTRHASVAGSVTPTGQELFQVGVPAAVAGDVVGTGGAGTLAFLSYGALARIYESKPVRNAILKLANTPAGSSAFERNLGNAHRAITAVAQGVNSVNNSSSK